MISTSIRSRDDILALIATSSFHIQTLQAVRALGLTDSWIAAGFIRNYVWDALHDYPQMTPLNDIDVIYYDAANQNEAFEKEQELRLKRLMQGPPWSVKNQARMHIKNGDTPYGSLDAALNHWCETVTPIAVRLNPDNSLTLKAPLGLEDLLNYRCHATPQALKRPEKLQAYRQRMQEKKWWELWPKVQVYDL